MPLLAAVEGGGTTFVLAIAQDHPTNIIERAEFDTTTPADTLRHCTEWLRQREYDAIGVACFGPLDLCPSSPTYGHITTTPKPGWQWTDVLGPIKGVRDVPYGFDTDVNAPALAEFAHANREDVKVSSCAYVTVGTGIGVGLVMNGQPVHGLMHPEGGHVCVPYHPEDAAVGFGGSNPRDTFGGHCVENLACSIALAKRAGLSGPAELRRLDDSHKVWEAAAHYLGALCANMVLLASPEVIVLSGGIMQRTSLFPRIRAAAQAHLNGYLQLPQLVSDDGIREYIVPSTWGNNAGLIGALTLAARAIDTAGSHSSSAAAEERQQELRKASAAAAAAAAIVGVAVGVAIGKAARR